MNNFKRRIKDMCQNRRNQKQDIKSKEKYKISDLEILQYVMNGDIEFYQSKVIEKNDEKDRIQIRSVNVEDETDIIEYYLNPLPAGRINFGGYISNHNSQDYRLYSMGDVWYKIFGERLSNDTEFTKDELLSMMEKIRKQKNQAQFERMYEVKYKKNYQGDKEFIGPKYFGAYYESNDQQSFEQIGEDGYFGETVGKRLMNQLVLNIGKKQINTNCVILGDIIDNRESDFEIKLITNIGRSRVYNRFKFTPQALRKIAREYEKEKEGGER